MENHHLGERIMLIPSPAPTNTPQLNAICRGTAWEMGCQQGEALREKIHQIRAQLIHLEAFRSQQPKWLPFALYRTCAERKSRRFLTRALREDKGHMDHLSGLATGANLDFKSLALFQAMEPILAAVDRNSSQAVSPACSAIAVGKNRSANGEPLIVRNFDYLPLVQPFYVLKRNEPTDGFRSLVFTVAPLLGAIDGVNECGLCITYNYAYAIDSAIPAPTISMRIADALNRFRTATEAAAWISRNSRWGAGLLMLADEGGDILALELSHTCSQIRRSSQKEEGLLYHSNAYQTPETQTTQVPSSAHWSKRAPKSLQGVRILASADARHRRFGQLLARQKQFDLDDLAQIMADHGPDGSPNSDTICVHSDYWHTTASLQLFPQTRKMRVSYSSACKARFHGFQL